MGFRVFRVIGFSLEGVRGLGFGEVRGLRVTSLGLGCLELTVCLEVIDRRFYGLGSRVSSLVQGWGSTETVVRLNMFTA